MLVLSVLVLLFSFSLYLHVANLRIFPLVQKLFNVFFQIMATFLSPSENYIWFRASFATRMSRNYSCFSTKAFISGKRFSMLSNKWN